MFIEHFTPVYDIIAYVDPELESVTLPQLSG